MKGQTLISRRTVLHGTGAAIGLPMLEAMMARSSLGSPLDAPPVRMVYLFVPNGMIMPDWIPEKEGPLESLPPILQPLGDQKANVLVLGGLTLDGARPHGDGNGGHARAAAAFLTGAHPRKTGGKDVFNGISVDQVAAQKIGRHTRFPSLELGCEARTGGCQPYSPIYNSNISWRSATQPLAKEINPRSLFNRLFRSEVAAAREQEAVSDDTRSILDSALEDARSLKRRLGSRDQEKLDEYLYAVRQVERRVKQDDTQAAAKVPDYPPPKGIPRDRDKHIRLMFDMLRLALVTDSTRVVTFMIANARSDRNFGHIGVPSAHHRLSHHGGDVRKIRAISKINRHYTVQLKYFLDALAQTREGERSLLDNSMILYGSGISDGNKHRHNNLPILLAGRGGGAISPGRFVRYADETPLTNLYLSMLDIAGAPTKQLADSTGPLDLS